MMQTVPDILARIVEHKLAELEAKPVPAQVLESQAATVQRRDFRAALESRETAIIAEIKKASPSKGLISANFQPAEQAKAYSEGGAAALSVLTDSRFFQGEIEHLQAARAAAAVPVLRKDFTLSAYHVLEAAAAGADAILLIAAILSAPQMREYRELAAQFGMAAIVEVHAEDELGRAIDSGAEIIGVNNRNLHTFRVTLETSLRLAERMPKGVLTVSESGIENAEQIRQLRGAGYRAFLIGEHLMRAGKPAEALRELLG